MIESQASSVLLTIEEQVELVKHGDSEIENYLLKIYQPFIAKCVSEVCKRYISRTKDDEFSIGLMAFNEAMYAYMPGKGSTFLTFARLVIKRKIIDYIRKEKNKIKATSLDELLQRDQIENPLEVSAAKAKYEYELDQSHRREEIKEFSMKLKEFKLSFDDLTRVSPKHKDARESAINVAKILFNDVKLKEYVLTKKKVPIKSLVNLVDVSKKTLERNRKFILAIFIILNEDYVYLKEYLRGIDL
ncbi:RNA polymerase sigma-I factor [Aquibacillus kalidii]|uniref:RNA polymerase sigma-I factor n=1 Tax=Aquibacillus kalidii TaxID=2762597 RepID=UPI0016485F94|nr:RNA polymerase sigma-I factor [Aquibacillus kalidii]